MGQRQFPQLVWGGYEVDSGQVVQRHRQRLAACGRYGLAYSTAGPTQAANVFIQQPAGATVAGPGVGTIITSLTLGSASGGTAWT